MDYCYSCMRVRPQNEEICPVCGNRHGAEEQPPFALQCGTLLHAGKYLVGKALERSGAFITYIGLDLSQNLKATIKECCPPGLADRTPDSPNLIWENSFDKDNIIEKLDSYAAAMKETGTVPNIAPVRDFFHANNTVYIVTDYIDGQNLRQSLKTAETLSPEDCLDALRPEDRFQTMAELQEALEKAVRQPEPSQKPVKKKRNLILAAALLLVVLLIAGMSRGNSAGKPQTGTSSAETPPEAVFSSPVDVSGMSAEEMFELGSRCYAGDGVEQSYETAVHLYTKAAEAGSADAMYALGYCYFYGQGTQIDLKTAAAWYTKAAEAGNTAAMANLGICYYTGKGVEKNVQTAAEWFTRGAEAGNAAAMYDLGHCYEKGIGVEKNRETANYWYSKAKEAGYTG